MNLQRNPHLILRTESGERYLPLVGTNCWTIGRSDDNQFVLPDRWISRNHAMMQRTEAGEVYVIDLVDGRFPNRKMMSSIEEERRLFYVAVTRAKDRLYLSLAKFDRVKKIDYKPSQFLHEAGLIKGEFVEPEPKGKKEKKEPTV